ncbi:PREDICTED: polyvinylalcohol dehydrogenase [Prunus dulcis]|uniref:PREDICTED: polyvinylalcohol dehydrogenase n=1 Tax=Prunus dulcis TaxID=3755 RepID=A0A5E4EZB0_PRUDU|nr:PREDICTED: polyvinylalcohol dehydrogenase [Prunus dulcis]
MRLVIFLMSTRRSQDQPRQSLVTFCSSESVDQLLLLPWNGQRGSSYGQPCLMAMRQVLLPCPELTTKVPENVTQCQENQTNNSTIPTHPDACVEPENHGNSILALDLSGGDIKWYHQLGGYDVWFVACYLNASNCPVGPNVDADFGEAPMMLGTYVNGTRRDIVVAVQKSGFAWALDRNNGSLVWSTVRSRPGGIGGGGTWGAATDKKRVYTNIANSDRKNFTLKPSSNITTAGGWVAMDARSGKVLWSTVNPSNASSPGPVSVANGVLFAGSPDPQGSLYAMNTRTGKILWSYETGASVYGGMSISNGCIYVGNGYNVSFGVVLGFTPGTSLYAFCIT